mmetsp:Transcript_19387/g.16210  ORF Transcript_19387/g.16210 Transcript_19387/m.16210 type:complete len:218 (-) Transcript_19387:77-730(-)
MATVTLIFVLLLRQYVFNARKEAGRSPRKSKPSPISVRDSAYNKGSSAKRRGSTSRGGTRHREHSIKSRSAGTSRPSTCAESPTTSQPARSPGHRAKPKSHSSRTSTPQNQLTPRSSVLNSDSPEDHIRSRIAGRPSPVPTKIAGDDGKVYEIDSIVDSRANGDIEEFLVTWVGHPPTSSTWEPGYNLPVHLIKEFKEFSSSSRARRHVKPPPSDSE